MEIFQALGPRVSAGSGYQLSSVSHLESELISGQQTWVSFRSLSSFICLLSYLPRGSQIFRENILLNLVFKISFTCLKF